MDPWEHDHAGAERARLRQKAHKTAMAELRSDIDRTLRAIEESRELLRRLSENQTGKAGVDRT